MANVFAFIIALRTTNKKRADSLELVKLMQKGYGSTQDWGPTRSVSVSNHYKSDRSRQEGDWPLVPFSPRKSAISLYVYTGNPAHAHLLEDLGTYTIGKACIYVKNLSDIHLEALERLMRATIEFLEETYGTIM